MTTVANWLLFDCDSTLSEIEGVDELARMRPVEILQEVEDLTNKAMNGEISLNEIFARRLEIIRPTKAECDAIGQLYIDRIEPTAVKTVQKATEIGWYPVIVSGGYTPVIRPLADHLGIEIIEAVDLFFDETGAYTGFATDHPNTRNGGKPEVIRNLRNRHEINRIVMVGDGISDLETKPEVDLFVGFGRYAARERVKAEANVFVHALEEVLEVLPE